jgi:hypothetical protein
MPSIFGKLGSFDEAEIKLLLESQQQGNDSPYVPKVGTGNHKEHPKYIYFYRIYLKNSRLGVEHYFWHRGNANDDASAINKLDAITPHGISIPTGGVGIDEALAFIARETQKPASDWKRNGADFDDPPSSKKLLWTIRSYVAFMIDDSAWDLLNANSGKPAISFDAEDATSGRKGNHSFYDAFSISVNPTGTAPRTVICMINHMKKNAGGTDLLAADGTQNFKFNLFAKVQLVGSTPENPKEIIVLIDPPGGNQGPPEAP